MTQLLVFLVAAAAVGPIEGQYEITTTVTVAGEAPVAPIKSTRCLTALEPAPRTPKGCAVFEVKTSGSVVSWRIQCSDARGGLEGSGSIEFKGDRFSGSSTTRMEKGGKKTELVETLEGRRTGPCAAPR